MTADPHSPWVEERFPTSGDNLIVADADDMAACLEAVRANDAAAVTVFGDAGRDWLRAASRNLAYKSARPVVGQGEKAVTQDFEICPQPPWESPWGACAGMMSDLVNAGLARMTQPPCPPVSFNEAVVQRYAPSDCGISPHRDHVRYVNLVGILVIDGEGDFFVCDDRTGQGATKIPAPPGSFLLMRAPGFDGSRYCPFHTLGAVHTPRLIVGYRQDTRPGEPD